MEQHFLTGPEITQGLFQMSMTSQPPQLQSTSAETISLSDLAEDSMSGTELPSIYLDSPSITATHANPLPTVDAFPPANAKAAEDTERFLDRGPTYKHNSETWKAIEHNSTSFTKPGQNTSYDNWMNIIVEPTFQTHNSDFFCDESREPISGTASALPASPIPRMKNPSRFKMLHHPSAAKVASDAGENLESEAHKQRRMRKREWARNNRQRELLTTQSMEEKKRELKLENKKLREDIFKLTATEFTCKLWRDYHLTSCHKHHT